MVWFRHRSVMNVIPALLIGWLTLAAPVSWAVCSAASLQRVHACCPADPGSNAPASPMPLICMLQMGGGSHAVPASDARTTGLQLPAALPPAPFELHAAVPSVVCSGFLDTPPPPRTRRLNIYYGVFLK